MGCGASHNDVIKNVLPAKGSTSSTGDKNLNGKSRKSDGLNNSLPAAGTNNPLSSLNSSTPGSAAGTNNPLSSLNSSTPGSATSTIPANEYYQNFNSRHEMSGNLKPLPNSLPPLKPPRSSKVGFLDQNTNESTELNKNGRVPVAFDVPAEEEAGSLIKKHPPRRLRRMDDQLPDALTQEVLDEKVQQANERRTQVLHQRVASARQKSARVATRMRSLPVFENEGEDGFPADV